MRPEGLGKLIKIIRLIESRNITLRLVASTTTLVRAPVSTVELHLILRDNPATSQGYSDKLQVGSLCLETCSRYIADTNHRLCISVEPQGSDKLYAKWGATEARWHKNRTAVSQGWTGLDWTGLTTRSEAVSVIKRFCRLSLRMRILNSINGHKIDLETTTLWRCLDATREKTK
jgi:hypothetical protein